jgi:uroporphyrinogen decarboxylase
MFDLIAEHYPVNALNWHDQLTAPSIAEAQTKFDGIVMGGIEEKEFLLQASKEEISQKVQEVVASANNKRLIIAPGCVIPINIPDKKVFAAINALK